MTGPKMELTISLLWQHFRDNTVLVLSNLVPICRAMEASVFLEPALMFYYFHTIWHLFKILFPAFFMKTMIASFCLSLFFEPTQLSGLLFYLTQDHTAYLME